MTNLNSTAGTIDLDLSKWNQQVQELKINWPQVPSEPVVYVEKENDLSERTFVMIKPDAFQRGLVGEILDLVSQRGLKLIAFKTLTMTPEDCEKHYSHHVGKDFYPKLVEFMTSGPSVAMVFEGNNACNIVRQLIGNSKHPSQVPPGSIRGRYALDFPRNLIHGSDHVEDSSREIRIHMEPTDIFDDNRLAHMREEFAIRKENAQARRRLLVEQGIKLGDEVFCPEVLQEGDWIASRKGVTLIKKVEPITTTKPAKIENADVLHITHEDYFTNWFGEKSVNAYTTDTAEKSMDFTWANSPLYLVGRDGEFLSSFVSEPIMKENGGRYIFKNGRFLPLFKKKSQVPLTLGKEPFVKMHTNPEGYLISDIYDPINQVVLKTASKNDPKKWRMILGGTGEELDKPELLNCTLSGARLRLKIWSKATPGHLSVLLYCGRPYAACYGDGKIHLLEKK